MKKIILALTLFISSNLVGRTPGVKQFVSFNEQMHDCRYALRFKADEWGAFDEIFKKEIDEELNEISFYIKKTLFGISGVIPTLVLGFTFAVLTGGAENIITYSGVGLAYLSLAITPSLLYKLGEMYMENKIFRRKFEEYIAKFDPYNRKITPTEIRPVFEEVYKQFKRKASIEDQSVSMMGFSSSRTSKFSQKHSKKFIKKTASKIVREIRTILVQEKFPNKYKHDSTKRFFKSIEPIFVMYSIGALVFIAACTTALMDGVLEEVKIAIKAKKSKPKSECDSEPKIKLPTKLPSIEVPSIDTKEVTGTISSLFETFSNFFKNMTSGF